jgi:hypothetical protein
MTIHARRNALLAGCLTLGFMISATAAEASVTVPSSALVAAQAMTTTPSLVSGATWIQQPVDPGNGNAIAPTVAIATDPEAGMPTAGTQYAIFTSGNSLDKLVPNTVVNQHGDGVYSDTVSTAPHDGGNKDVDDLTTLRVAISVPSGDDCLALDFRFFSEEYPQYVNQFDDGFLVELDRNDWTTTTTGSTFNAPGNFIFDTSNGWPLSVNTTGTLGMTLAGAAGTGFSGTTTVSPAGAFGGGTALLSAETPVSPGAHVLYFSAFDEGDHALDTGVFLDNLRAFTAASACPPGAVLASQAAAPTAPSAPVLSAAAPANGTSTSATITFTGDASLPYACSLNGATPTACTSPDTLSGLSVGPQVLLITQTNAGVSGSPLSVAWIVSAPSLPLLAPTLTPIPTLGSSGSATCVSARIVTLHWTLPAGRSAQTLTVTVNAKTYRRLADTAQHVTISMVGLPAETVVVQVAATTASGTLLATTRRYHTCEAARSAPPLGSLVLKPAKHRRSHH